MKRLLGHEVRLACTIATLTAILFGGAVPAAAVRLKDIARIDAGGERQLVGYGLVVGLDGSGDSRSSIFTAQSVANMLTRMGVIVEDDRIRARNVAAVMVIARINRFHRVGTSIDVTVSSMGDASSLEGGTLLPTPVATPDGTVYCTAQGPVSVGGFSVRGAGSDRSSQNYVLTGRVPGGGIVEREWVPEESAETVNILLLDPDFTTAQRVATAINEEIGANSAQALDASTVVLTQPTDVMNENRVALLSRIESLEVEPDIAALVVVNERTGTIVAGEHVTIASVAIAHGNLSVQVRGTPLVSQPPPFSRGETQVTETTEVSVSNRGTTLQTVAEPANIGDLAQALNALGVTPRDMIAIFQALKNAGALRAELRIL